MCGSKTSPMSRRRSGARSRTASRSASSLRAAFISWKKLSAATTAMTPDAKSSHRRIGSRGQGTHRSNIRIATAATR